MNGHSAETNRQVAAGARRYHPRRRGLAPAGRQAARPGNISPPHLPPSPPGLNPAGNTRRFLRQNHRSNRIREAHGAIIDARREAWNAFVAEPGRITSTASCERARAGA